MVSRDERERGGGSLRMEYSSGVFLFTLGTWRGEVSVERHLARVEEIIQIGSIEMDAYLLGENTFWIVC